MTAWRLKRKGLWMNIVISHHLLGSFQPNWTKTSNWLERFAGLNWNVWVRHGALVYSKTMRTWRMLIISDGLRKLMTWARTSNPRSQMVRDIVLACRIIWQLGRLREVASWLFRASFQAIHCGRRPNNGTHYIINFNFYSPYGFVSTTRITDTKS